MGTRGPRLGIVLVGSQGNVGWNLIPRKWNNQDLSDDETFARLTHESSDGSNDFAVDTLNRTGDGWGSFRDPQPVPPGVTLPRSSHLGNRIQIQVHQEARTHAEDMSSRRSNELSTNMPVIVEPLEVPSSSERAPARWKQLHLMLFILCQRITSDSAQTMKILSGHDEDVSSMQDGCYLGIN